MLFSLNVLVYYRPGDLFWGVPRILVSVCGESSAEYSGQRVRQHFAKAPWLEGRVDRSKVGRVGVVISKNMWFDCFSRCRVIRIGT